MIVSLAEILIFSLIVDWAFRKISIPGLVGMLRETGFARVANERYKISLLWGLMTASACKQR